MSRCFPFPPPGYEERLRPEENLLKEEKFRNKKLKKEKKDKEKREGKDKRKREKGNGNQKEKKDKKEKHRDKKGKHKCKKDEKDENKRTDNEKSSISEDASIVRELETTSTGKVHMGEVCFVDKGSGIDKTKVYSPCQSQDEQESIDHSLDRETTESQFLLDLRRRRIRDEGRATASKLGRSSAAYIGLNEEISSGAYIRREEEMHKSALRNLQRLAEVKARNGDRRVDQRQKEAQALQDGAQLSGTVPRGLARSVDNKVEGTSGSVHKSSDRIVQRIPKCNEDGDHDLGGQSKCKDRKGKKNHGKDKGRENEEKMKERADHKSRDQEKSKMLYKNGSPRLNNSNSYLLAVDTKVVSTEENVKKRKNVEAKGLVPENELRHNKLPRVTLYLPKDNGHITCQSLDLLDSDRNGISLQDKEDIKNCEASGAVDAPSSYISKQMAMTAFAASCQIMKDSIKASPFDEVVKASSELLQASLAVKASVKRPLVDKVIKISRRSSQDCPVVEGSKKNHHVNEIAEPPRKPPHPDMKYLSQVQSVPERKEFLEVDNEDWLFSGKGPLFQKQKHDVSASCDYGQQQVWSETLHIESTDTYALPYVIPY